MPSQTTTSVPPPPVVTPKPKVPLPPTEDGSNIRACSDGVCEVLVVGQASITFTRNVGLATMTITVAPDGVDFGGVSPSGTVVNAREQRPDQGGPSTINKMTIAVVAIDGTSAVIRLGKA
ncbi:hypothetical protein [Herbihabitans rhizosphaerae]|nr:hypothetical protein [Herbihabitans rhizosphaerae]